MVPAQFIKSQRGHNLINISGFLFSKNSSRGNISYWRCTQRTPLICPGFVKTMLIDDTVFINCNVDEIDHNHIPQPHMVDKLNMVDSLKSSAKNSLVSPVQIIQSAFVDVPSTSAPYLPNKNAMKQIINRERRNKFKDVNCLDDIPDSLKMVNGKKFLHYNKVIDEIGRIIIFTTEENLKQLETAMYWIMDGTFKCTSRPAVQLYTIHALVGTGETQRTVPLVYGLLPCKTEECYSAFFEQLKRCGEVYNLELSPLFIITDFEMATINACSRVFDDSCHKCCFFHFTQNIWKQIQKLGLAVEYGKNSDFALRIRHLFALAFLSPNEIPGAFERIKTEGIIPESAHSLLEWFDQYYVNGKLKSKNTGPTSIIMKKTKPLFPPKLWSVYDNTNNNLPRTQNVVESWHRRWNTLLGGNKWNMNIMFSEFVKEQNMTELKIERIRANIPVTPPKKKTMKVYEDSLQRIINNREDIDLMDFLKKISYVYRI